MQPIWIAAYNADIECINFELDHGADLGVLDGPSECTPLHIAIKTNKQNAHSTALFLIKRHADVNCRDKDNNTPLHDAARNDSRSIVELLLIAGAHVGVVNKDGDTALSISTNHGYSETSLVIRNLAGKFCGCGRNKDGGCVL
jgi:cytohesin